MRAFVLGTGRCGTTTWARACERLPGAYTVGHESRAGEMIDRLVYPDEHVEVDNRLVWFLGELGDRHDDGDTVWVHLTRDEDAVVASIARRMRVRAGILPAFASGVLRQPQPTRPSDVRIAAQLLVRTVTRNVDAFLRDRRHVVHADISRPHASFDAMCDLLGVPAEGRERAHNTLQERYNAGRIR